MDGHFCIAVALCVQVDEIKWVEEAVANIAFIVADTVWEHDEAVVGIARDQFGVEAILDVIASLKMIATSIFHITDSFSPEGRERDPVSIHDPKFEVGVKVGGLFHRLLFARAEDWDGIL